MSSWLDAGSIGETMKPDPSKIGRSELRELLSLWNARCVGDDIPRIETVSPVDITPYLRNVMLVEIEESTGRIRYRQVGEELARFYGERVDGTYLDEMPGRFRRFAEPAYREVLSSREPSYARFRFVENWWIASYERLMLPLLAMEEDRIAELIVAIYPKVDRRTS